MFMTCHKCRQADSAGSEKKRKEMAAVHIAAGKSTSSPNPIQKVQWAEDSKLRSFGKSKPHLLF